jgi:F-type H+-transporting ATPase subunit a
MAANPLDHVSDDRHWHLFDAIGGGLSIDLSPLHFYAFGHRFQLTKFMLLEVLAALLIIGIYVWPGGVARRSSDGSVPKGPFQNAFEGVLTFIRDQVARPYIGEHDADRYLPFLWTLFLFVLVLNVMGLVPFMASPTASLGVTGALALISFFVIHGSGIAKLGVGGYLKSYVPDTGLPVLYVLPLILLIIVIEAMSHFIKAFVLAVRLFANMLGGHTVLAVILGFITMVGKKGLLLFVPITLASVLGVFALGFLELFVAFLQAYIFVFLTAIFLGGVLHPEH